MCLLSKRYLPAKNPNTANTAIAIMGAKKLLMTSVMFILTAIRTDMKATTTVLITAVNIDAAFDFASYNLPLYLLFKVEVADAITV